MSKRPGARGRSAAPKVTAAPAGFSARLRALHEVSNLLTLAPSFDELCREAVVLGRERLGFDRLSIWPLDAEPHTLRGTFGIDERGEVRDERQERRRPSPEGPMGRILARREPSSITYDTDLFDGAGRVVGHGTHLVATLWDGNETRGCVCVDNLLSQRPITAEDGDLLTLYATTLGHLWSRRRSEDALRLSEQRYRELVEFFPGAVFRIAPEPPFRVLDINGQVERVYAYSRDDIMSGRVNFNHVFVDEEKPAILATTVQAVAERRSYTMEVRFQRGDGSVGWFLMQGQPVYDDQGRPLYVVGSQVDISQRKAAEERQAAMLAGVRAILAARDELLLARNLKALYRRAVELAHEKLGIERGTIFLAEAGGLRATYGTNENGELVDTSVLYFPGEVEFFAERFARIAPHEGRWLVEPNASLGSWDGHERFHVAYGWKAITPIPSRVRGELVGIFSNDTAITGAPLNEVQQELLAVYCASVGGIIERKRGEEALRRSEERYRELADTLPHTVFECDVNGRLLFANRAALKAFGYTPAASERITDVLSLIAPASRAGARERFQNALQAKAPSQSEYRFLRADGRSFPGLIATAPIVRDGKAIGLRGIVIDISERKDFERRQAAMSAGLRGIVEAAHELIGTPDEDTLLRRAVELAREKLGIERARIYIESGGMIHGAFGTDAQGRTTDERDRCMTHEAASWAEWVSYLAARASPWDVDKADLYSWVDGQKVPIRPETSWNAVTLIYSQARSQAVGLFINDTAMSGAPVDEAQQELVAIYCSVLGNIIERRRAETRQAAVSAGLRRIVEAADELIATPDRDTLFRRAVELAREKLGLERCGLAVEDGPLLRGTFGTDMQGRTTDERLYVRPVANTPWWQARVAKLQASADPWVVEVHDRLNWNGADFKVCGHGWVALTPVHTQPGPPFGVLSNDAAISGAPLDATRQELAAVYCTLLGNILEQKRVEEALRASEERFRAIMDSTSNVIVVWDEQCRYAYANPAVLALMNRPPRDVVGKDIYEVLGRDSANARLWRERIESVLATGRELRVEDVVHWRGRAVWSEASLSPLRDAAGNPVAAAMIWRNVSDRKHLEHEILEISAREQRRIGRDLHDVLGQHLTGVAFLVSSLHKRLETRKLHEAEDAELIEDLINEGIAHVRALARGLSPVDLGADGLLEGLHQLAADTRRMFDVECSLTADDSLRIEDSDAAMHIYRIVQEAINNAMRHGKATRLDISLAAAADGYELCVADNGIGMQAASPAPRGIGLDIMMYRARMIGGTLTVQGNETGGTAVRLLFRERGGP